MKKICLLLCTALLLCLAACGADGESSGTAENSSGPASEMTADVPEGNSGGAGSAASEKEAFSLTRQGKDFLAELCRILGDFDAGTQKDEAFWRNFLFSSYTGLPEGAETEQIYREDLDTEETVVKVSLEEAEAYAKLVFGVDLPEVRPSFEEMEEGQTAFYYQNGFYYIGVSDFPDYRYSFADSVETGASILVRYTMDLEGERNVGAVSFTIVPEENENGFILTSKTTEFFDRSSARP